MTRMNFTYMLTDTKGTIIKTGNINYSISHFVYALFRRAIKPNISPSVFFSNLKHQINSPLNGIVSLSILQQNFQMLSWLDRIQISNTLHSFGYFAFVDINKTQPFFIKHRNHVSLVDNKNNEMDFHLNKNIITKGAFGTKIFNTSFGLVGTNQQQYVQGNSFHLNIIDPINENGRNFFDEYRSLEEVKNNIVKEIARSPLIFKFKNDNENYIAEILPYHDNFDCKQEYYTDNELIVKVSNF